MEVPLTPEQEEELKAIAAREGRNAHALAQEILGVYLKREAQFVAAVKRGIASAERGILLSTTKCWQGSNAYFIPDAHPPDTGCGK